MVTHSESQSFLLLITGNMLSHLDEVKTVRVLPVDPLAPHSEGLVGPDEEEEDEEEEEGGGGGSGPIAAQPGPKRGQGRGRRTKGRRPGPAAAASKNKGGREQSGPSHVFLTRS